jgi:hypothetical protein
MNEPSPYSHLCPVSPAFPLDQILCIWSRKENQDAGGIW